MPGRYQVIVGVITVDLPGGNPLAHTETMTSAVLAGPTPSRAGFREE